MLKIKLYTSSIVTKHTNINLLWYIDLQCKARYLFFVQCIFFKFESLIQSLSTQISILSVQHSRNLCQKTTNLYSLTSIDLNISCCYFICLTGFTYVAICNYPESDWSFNSQGKREIKCRIPQVGPCRQLYFNSLLGEVY